MLTAAAMKTLILAACLAAAPARAAVDEHLLLTPGTYTVAISGLLCTTCAKTIVSEVGRLPEVQSAHVDFEQDRLIIAIRGGRSLRFSHLVKALKRAAKIVNLPTRFEVESVRYRP
jgi:hypothetical protein